MKLRAALGLDGAIAFTLSARLISISGSAGTVLLIVRFLSPVEQGYYYTLLSLVSLQIVFEMGFSFVIQQIAAHECVRLKFHDDGSVSGENLAHQRLASILRLSVRWYAVAGIAMILILAPLGALIFENHATTVSMPVAWQGPWIAAVVASALALCGMPFYSFLEGCGQVEAVAKLRLRQSVATAACAWAPMIVHRGLYSPALAIAGYAVTGSLFLVGRRHLLAGMLRHRAGKGAIRWTAEVWPFQWRVASSWMCSYFAVQIFIPILFAARGAAEAGQMGMSLSITGYLTVLALAWTSTKSTPFGRMVAYGELQQLDSLFLRTLAQSMIVFGLMAMAACCIAVYLPTISPRLSSRMVPASLFAVLVMASAANFIVQSIAIVLRSFKSEPFLTQSLTVASLTLILAAATVSRWGSAGAAWSYFFATAGIGLPFALRIFIRSRRRYLALTPLTVCGSESG